MQQALLDVPNIPVPRPQFGNPVASFAARVKKNNQELGETRKRNLSMMRTEDFYVLSIVVNVGTVSQTLGWESLNLTDSQRRAIEATQGKIKFEPPRVRIFSSLKDAGTALRVITARIQRKYMLYSGDVWFALARDLPKIEAELYREYARDLIPEERNRARDLHDDDLLPPDLMGLFPRLAWEKGRVASLYRQDIDDAVRSLEAFLAPAELTETEKQTLIEQFLAELPTSSDVVAKLDASITTFFKIPSLREQLAEDAELAKSEATLQESNLRAAESRMRQAYIDKVSNALGEAVDRAADEILSVVADCLDKVGKIASGDRFNSRSQQTLEDNLERLASLLQISDTFESTVTRVVDLARFASERPRAEGMVKIQRELDAIKAQVKQEIDPCHPDAGKGHQALAKWMMG